jgi:two-component system sensor histidine kinase RegB
MAMHAPLSPFPAVSIELGRAQQRIGLLRWGMLALSGLALLTLPRYGLILAWPLLLQSLLTLALINLALYLLSLRGTSPMPLIRIGLAADVFALTEVLAFSGGAANPLASLYLPPLLFSALVSPGLFSWCLSGFSLLAYGLLFFWHLPWPLSGSDAAYAFYAHQLGMWLIFALSALLMTGFISYLSRQLAERDEQLAAARESQLRDEQLVGLGMQAAMAAHSLSTPLNTVTLLVDEWCDAPPEALPEQELALMKGQLRVCREALTRLKHSARTGTVQLQLFSALSERLEGWCSLRPDVTLRWSVPDGPDPIVELDTAFWPALFNLINNAAEAGGGVVGVSAHYGEGALQLDIVNREGWLSEAQLKAAGLSQLQSGKKAGLGIGVLLSHATLARLGGSLTLDNRPAGGVHARIVLPLKQGQS